MVLRKMISVFGGIGIALAAATAVSAATFEIVPSISEDSSQIIAEIAVSPNEGETSVAFNGYTLNLGYDSSVLTPVATDEKDPLGDDLYAANTLTDLSGVFVADNVVAKSSDSQSNVAIGWASAENKSTEDKLVIAKVTFNVLKKSDTQITLDVTAYAKNASELDTLFAAGTDDASSNVKFAADVIKGDVNSDEKVNVKDVVLLRQYLAGWSSAELNDSQQSAADVNNDEKVNVKDVVKIRQYLAGWPGITLE